MPWRRDETSALRKLEPLSQQGSALAVIAAAPIDQQ
jgi:hypothetical protein